MRTFVKIMVAAIVAMGVLCVLIAYDASDNVCLVGYVATAIAMCGVLGVFSEPAKRENLQRNSIRHRMGGRSYGQAAVFVGSAILFMVTPKQCEDVADDLQHYGVQAKADTLTGNETFEIL